MTIKNFIHFRRRATRPAAISLRNAFGVLQALIRQLNQKKDTLLEVAGFQVPQHVWEQTVWRRTQVKEKSPDCWTQGACIVCGCEILGRTLEDRPCEGSCYPAMMDAPTWTLFKKFHDIKLFD